MRNPSNLDDFTDVWLTHLPVGATIIVAVYGSPGDRITLTHLGAGLWGDITDVNPDPAPMIGVQAPAQVRSEKRRAFTSIADLVTAMETLDAFGNDYVVVATTEEHPSGEAYRVWTMTTIGAA